MMLVYLSSLELQNSQLNLSRTQLNLQLTNPLTVDSGVYDAGVPVKPCSFNMLLHLLYQLLYCTN
jgi:hypothetical protein